MGYRALIAVCLGAAIASPAMALHREDLHQASHELTLSAEQFYETLHYEMGEHYLLGRAGRFAEKTDYFYERVARGASASWLRREYDDLVRSFDRLARGYSKATYAQYQPQVAGDFSSVERALDRVGYALHGASRHYYGSRHEYWPWHRYSFWIDLTPRYPVYGYAPRRYGHRYFGTRRHHRNRHHYSSRRHYPAKRDHRRDHRPRHRDRHYPPNDGHNAANPRHNDRHRGFDGRRGRPGNGVNPGNRGRQDGDGDRRRRDTRPETRRPRQPGLDPRPRPRVQAGGSRFAPNRAAPNRRPPDRATPNRARRPNAVSPGRANTAGPRNTRRARTNQGPRRAAPGPKRQQATGPKRSFSRKQNPRSTRRD